MCQRRVALVGMADLEGVSGAKFAAPPVVEVAVAIEFVPMPSLGVVRLVGLAERWRDEFPNVEEQVAIPPQPDPTLFLDSTGLQIHQGLQPLRLWLLQADRRGLLQVQHDRLILNWRRGDDGGYPSYKTLRERYHEKWLDLKSYVLESNIGPIRPSVAEVTFVNQISCSSPDLSDVLRTVAGGVEVSAGRHGATLVSTSVGQVATVSSAYGSGRVTISANYAPDDLAVILTITTRIALMDGMDDERMLKTLDFAHDVGVQAFVDSTRPAMHTVWERYQ